MRERPKREIDHRESEARERPKREGGPKRERERPERDH